MGVFVLENLETCNAQTLSKLQKGLDGAANAFCFLDRYTAANLPDSTQPNAFQGLQLTKLDIQERNAEQAWNAGIITLVTMASLFALAAVWLFTTLAKRPSFC